MDCGWRNLEVVADNYLERQKPLASRGDCTDRDRPPTSGTPDALPPFALMISLQPPPASYFRQRRAFRRTQ